MIPIPAFTVSPRLLLAGAVALSVFYGGWAARAYIAKGDIAALKLAHQTAVNAAAEKVRSAEADARKRESALTEQTQGIVNEARAIVQTLERHIGASGAASRSMLDAAARVASRCNASPGSALAGGSAGAAVPSGRADGERLMRLVAELDGFAGAAAEDADRSRVARSACQRAYEAAMVAVNN